MIKTIFEKLTNKDVRHITFEGDPVNESLCKIFLRNSSFKLATTISALSYFMPQDNKYVTPFILIPAAVFAVGALYEYKIRGLRKAYYEAVFPENSCIDKNGRRALFTNESIDCTPAVTRTIGQHLATGAMMCSSLAATSAFTWLNDMSGSVKIAGQVIWLMPAFKEFSAAYRFYKVYKKSWAIVKKPPVEQKQEDSIPDAMPEAA